jgi:hypothetical protein
MRTLPTRKELFWDTLEVLTAFAVYIGVTRDHKTTLQIGLGIQRPKRSEILPFWYAFFSTRMLSSPSTRPHGLVDLRDCPVR